MPEARIGSMDAFVVSTPDESSSKLRRYGHRQGLLMVPARIAQAASPWVFGIFSGPIGAWCAYAGPS